MLIYLKIKTKFYDDYLSSNKFNLEKFIKLKISSFSSWQVMQCYSKHRYECMD